MRKRVEAIHGQLDLTSTNGEGTRTKVTAPLQLASPAQLFPVRPKLTWLEYPRWSNNPRD
jgi:hypothetical protein